MAFKSVTSPTNERTVISSFLPFAGVANSMIVVTTMTRSSSLEGLLLANLNSLVLDYISKQKVGGVNLNFFIVYQFPLLPPTIYHTGDLDFIVPRVLELTYTAWDIQPFAQDLGYEGPPFPWDEERRALLRAELDAYYAALYGLTRDELRYILDPADVFGPDFPGETFHVLKEREIKQYGEYRTRRLVLEAWDRLGLAPRNRDGRYAVEEAESSLDPRQAGNAKPSVGRSPEHGKAKRAVAETEVKWPTRQAGLPGVEKGRQGSFGDLGTEK